MSEVSSRSCDLASEVPRLSAALLFTELPAHLSHLADCTSGPARQQNTLTGVFLHWGSQAGLRKTTARDRSSGSWRQWGAERWGRQLWAQVQALFWCWEMLLSRVVIFRWKLPYQFIQNKTAIMWKLWRGRKEHNDPSVTNMCARKSRFNLSFLKEMWSI